MKKLETFLKVNDLSNQKRRSSKLDEFKEEINQLYEQGFKIEVIQQFLKENGAEVSQRSIYYYLKKQKANQKNFSLQNSSSEAGKNTNNEIEQTDDQEINLKNLRSTLKNIRSNK